MFSFFTRRKPQAFQSYGFLGVDIHSHLIPGIDDGVPDIDTAMECLQLLQDAGYKKVITTPHIIQDYYPNTSTLIRQSVTEVQQAVRERGLDIEVEAAAEYLLDDYFVTLLQQDDLLTFGTPNYLLVELSFLVPPLNLEDLIFQIMTKGYQPILAHPERYSYFRESSERLHRIREQGCHFQMNLLSLVGQYGSRVQQQARQLLSQSMIDFLGTDIHRPKDAGKVVQLLQSRELDILEPHTFLNRTLL